MYKGQFNTETIGHPSKWALWFLLNTTTY